MFPLNKLQNTQNIQALIVCQTKYQISLLFLVQLERNVSFLEEYPRLSGGKAVQAKPQIFQVQQFESSAITQGRP